MDESTPIRIILASASPRRRRILTSLGVRFSVHLPHCKEVLYPDDAVATVGKNAAHKALSVQKNHPHSLIIAADTAVAFKGRVYGKPASYEEAQDWLLSFAGRSQQVYTGVAFLHPGLSEPELFIEASSLRFKVYSLDTVQDYLDRVKPFDRAGAYDINDHGEMLIEACIGSKSNVMGLPRALVHSWLHANGVVLHRDEA